MDAHVRDSVERRGSGVVRRKVDGRAAREIRADHPDDRRSCGLDNIPDKGLGTLFHFSFSFFFRDLAGDFGFSTRFFPQTLDLTPYT